MPRMSFCHLVQSFMPKEVDIVVDISLVAEQRDSYPHIPLKSLIYTSVWNIEHQPKKPLRSHAHHSFVSILQLLLFSRFRVAK